jgi:hypothetical protein
MYIILEENQHSHICLWNLSISTTRSDSLITIREYFWILNLISMIMSTILSQCIKLFDLAVNITFLFVLSTASMYRINTNDFYDFGNLFWSIEVIHRVQTFLHYTTSVKIIFTTYSYSIYELLLTPYTLSWPLSSSRVFLAEGTLQLAWHKICKINKWQARKAEPPRIPHNNVIALVSHIWYY